LDLTDIFNYLGLINSFSPTGPESMVRSPSERVYFEGLFTGKRVKPRLTVVTTMITHQNRSIFFITSFTRWNGHAINAVREAISKVNLRVNKFDLFYKINYINKL